MGSKRGNMDIYDMTRDFLRSVDISISDGRVSKGSGTDLRSDGVLEKGILPPSRCLSHGSPEPSHGASFRQSSWLAWQCRLYKIYAVLARFPSRCPLSCSIPRPPPPPPSCTCSTAIRANQTPAISTSASPTPSRSSSSWRRPPLRAASPPSYTLLPSAPPRLLPIPPPPTPMRTAPPIAPPSSPQTTPRLTASPSRGQTTRTARA